MSTFFMLTNRSAGGAGEILIYYLSWFHMKSRQSACEILLNVTMTKMTCIDQTFE